MNKPNWIELIHETLNPHFTSYPRDRMFSTAQRMGGAIIRDAGFIFLFCQICDSTPGGALPYWRWRAAGQGMIYTVIHIGTGYLNRPNWLLAGYSVYHRVASRLPSRVASPQCLWQARNLGTSDGAWGTTMFMTGSRSPRSGTSNGARGTQQIFMNVWWYTAE